MAAGGTNNRRQVCLVRLAAVVVSSAIAAWPGSARAHEYSSYTLPITRDGRTITRVAVDHWTGEYPRPVIDLNSKVHGSTKVRGYRTLRQLEQPADCLIRNGIYHPWAPGTESMLTFYTLVPLIEYEVLLDDGALKRGDRVSQVVYGSENVYSGMVAGTRISIRGYDLQDPTRFKKLPSEASEDFEEQWLYLRCNDGKKLFIRDIDLLNTPGATLGRTVAYGRVGSGAEDDSEQTVPTPQPDDGSSTSGPSRKKLQERCDSGKAEACYELGLAWGNGDDGPRSLAEARRWVERACSLGHAGACAFLPDMAE